MISKKLLNLVLDKEVFWTEVRQTIPNSIRVHYDQERYLSDCEDINLDTLGRRCETFCENLGYDLRTHITSENTIICEIFKIENQSFIKGILYEKTKLESKIKATEWIAKEKEQKRIAEIRAYARKASKIFSKDT